MLKKWLFRLARCRWMGKMVGLAFQYCPWAIPGKKTCQSNDVIALRHPQPSYENHIILSPRKAVSTLRQMAEERYGDWFHKIWIAAKALAQREYQDGFVLMANGGKRQDVQQVHFHLFTGHEMLSVYAPAPRAGEPLCREGAVGIWAHPQPEWALHFVLSPLEAALPPTDEEALCSYLDSVLRSIAALDAQFSLTEMGYSLVWQCSRQPGDEEWPVFHIIAGKRKPSAD